MKGLLKYKPIHEGIICHATLDDFGQFLLTSRFVKKTFYIVVIQLQFNLKFIIFGYSLNSIRYHTHKEDIIQAAVNQNPHARKWINNKKHPLYLSVIE
jgi:hypothetical protein